jgi:hypothetical protein
MPQGHTTMLQAANYNYLILHMALAGLLFREVLISITTSTPLWAKTQLKYTISHSTICTSKLKLIRLVVLLLRLLVFYHLLRVRYQMLDQRYLVFLQHQVK